MSTLGIVIASWIGGGILALFAYVAWFEWGQRRDDRRKARWIERFPR